MDNEALNAFLARSPLPDPDPPQEPQAEPREAEAPGQRPGGTPEPAAAQPDAKSAAASAEPEPEDNAEPPAPQEGEAVVPRRVLEAIRHERQDWKAKAIAAQTERDLLQKQVEEAKRAVAQPPPQPQYQQPPPPPPQIPNPAIDPVGYHNYIQAEQTKRDINSRLNQSEMMMRDKIGNEAVEAIIAEFGQAAQADPSLFQKLYQQVHPYQWAANHVERMRLHKEIGDDPAAYKARLFAEWQAQQTAGGLMPTNGNGNGAAHPRAVPQLAPSLATARSVAGRSAPAFTGPPSLDDIFAKH